MFEPLNANVNSDDGSCVTELIYGCIYSSYTEYNPNTNVPDNDLCQVLKEFGCTNELASNFNVDANVDDGSCIIEGCTNVLSFNYNVEETSIMDRVFHLFTGVQLRYSLIIILTQILIMVLVQILKTL